MRPKKLSIICFSWDPWSPMWKMTQQLMWHLASKRRVEKVLFLNEDFYISNIIEKLPFYILNPQMRKKILRALLGKVQKVEENVIIYNPVHYVPFIYRSAWLKKVDAFLMVGMLKRILKKHGFQNVILFINRIVDEKILDLFDDVVLRCFYWSDDWASFPKETEKVDEVNSEKKRHISKAIEKILKRVDIVFSVSDYLTNKAKMYVSKSYWLPNGTDYRNFVRASLDETSLPQDIQNIPKPIIGFVGYITSTLDFELLDYTAKARPDWSFVFIGPKLPAASWGEKFFKLPNVHYLGPKPYFELPMYMKAFDVCIIPYLNHPSLQAADSNKVYDYLATGKPIVASYNTAGLGKFEGIIKISGSKEKFVTDIENSLREKENEKLAKKRQEIAKENSWEKRADYMWKKIEALL